MKKVIFLMLVCITLLASMLVMPASAEQPISVYVNGEKLEFDVAPVLLNDRTMVPMRKIFETLGATVSWNGDTETASGVRNGIRVSVSIDNPKAFIDGKATSIDQPPVLLDGRTLVPLRFIAEAYGAQVEWVDATQTVNIT
ncbi:MAG: copper amine oxidase N-terminal domain-containing protein, partial [Clostridia bacterium]|nr:copper amine oxidase N-terminal domain-containing protein [Clostridia bacterium]